MTRAYKSHQSVLTVALSLAIAASLSISGATSGWAAKKGDDKDKTPAKVQRSDRKSTRQLPKETMAPVLDDQARKAILEAGDKLDPSTKAMLAKLSEAVHVEDKAIQNELRDDEELAVTDIGMLWEAAVERSGTIRYAIEKLSRRDATGKPVENDSFSKRMLNQLVQLGGVAGSMWTQTPAGLIGSGMVQDLMSGAPDQSALSRVTDADMVMLAKEVESLQSELLERYYNYRHAKESLTLAQEASATIAKYHNQANSEESGTDEALLPLVQSIYDSAKQDEQSAAQAFNTARSTLAQMVGTDAIAALEQSSKTAKSTQNIP